MVETTELENDVDVVDEDVDAATVVACSVEALSVVDVDRAAFVAEETKVRQHNSPNMEMHILIDLST